MALFIVAVVLIVAFAILQGVMDANKEKKENKKRQRKQNALNARRQRIQNASTAYQNLLDELETRPTDPKLRRACLEQGRQYARLCRENGAETTFDELSIRNDIDAACAGSVSANALPITDTSHVATETVVSSAIPVPPFKPTSTPTHTHQQSARKSNPVKFLGCGCFFLVLFFCMVGLLIPRPNNHVESTSKRSSATRVEKSIKQAEAKKGEAKNFRSRGGKQDEVQLTGKKLIAELESLGFLPSVKWKKSKVEAGWIGIWHLKNANAPDGLLNEVSIQLIGATGNQIDKAIIEAEIYNEDFKEATMKNGVACVKLLNAPNDVVEAFQSGGELKKEPWEISRDPHARGSGYDIECVHTFIANEKKSQPSSRKSPAIKKDKADTKSKPGQMSFLKQYRKKLNAAGLNEQIITRLAGDGKKVKITVVDAWSEMDYNSRYEAADTLYKLWAMIASPDSPDSARISIQTEGGTEIGGSRLFAGSLIWVQK